MRKISERADVGKGSVVGESGFLSGIDSADFRAKGMRGGRKEKRAGEEITNTEIFVGGGQGGGKDLGIRRGSRVAKTDVKGRGHSARRPEGQAGIISMAVKKNVVVAVGR